MCGEWSISEELTSQNSGAMAHTLRGQSDGADSQPEERQHQSTRAKEKDDTPTRYLYPKLKDYNF